MKKLLLTISFFVVAGIAFAQQKYYPQALVELYSSEGCENCPYADAFMKQILQIADSSKQPVYVLDFHVDIWDQSGWKDPYSDSAYSARQLMAAKRVEQPAIFTPMVFINGQFGLPGGAKREVGFHIASALQSPRERNLITSANFFHNKNILAVDYTIEGSLDSTEIHFAFVEKHAFSKVTAGDNNGKTLEHHNVVRKFGSEVVKANKGHYELAIPNDVKDMSKYALITFLQRQNGGYVYAVDELLFTTE